MASKNDIQKFHRFAEKFLDSEWFCQADLDVNAEKSMERVKQIFLDFIPSDNKQDEMKRYAESDESFTLLLYLDRILFDIVQMARPEKTNELVGSKGNVIRYIENIDLKMEIILYLFQEFSITDDSIREFLMRYINYMNSAFNWINADVDNLFEDFNLNVGEAGILNSKLYDYKESAMNIKIYTD